MRASGKATESRMTVTIVFIMLGLLVLLAGGPGEFLKVVERILETGLDAGLKVYQGMRG